MHRISALHFRAEATRCSMSYQLSGIIAGDMEGLIKRSLVAVQLHKRPGKIFGMRQRPKRSPFVMDNHRLTLQQAPSEMVTIDHGTWETSIVGVARPYDC